MNFSKGTAAFCIDAIVSQKDLQLARERIKGEHQKGKSIREQLKSAKRVTSGVVFGSGTTRLGKTVFDICQENADRKKKELIKKMKTDEAKYLKDVESAKKVFEKKSDLETMTISELTRICKPLKRKSDGKMPQKKVDLIAKYKEWSGRPTPVFEVQDIPSNDDDESITKNNDDVDIEIGVENVVTI